MDLCSPSRKLRRRVDSEGSCATRTPPRASERFRSRCVSPQNKKNMLLRTICISRVYLCPEVSSSGPPLVFVSPFVPWRPRTHAKVHHRCLKTRSSYGLERTVFHFSQPFFVFFLFLICLALCPATAVLLLSALPHARAAPWFALKLVLICFGSARASARARHG